MLHNDDTSDEEYDASYCKRISAALEEKLVEVQGAGQRGGAKPYSTFYVDSSGCEEDFVSDGCDFAVSDSCYQVVQTVGHPICQQATPTELKATVEQELGNEQNEFTAESGNDVTVLEEDGWNSGSEDFPPLATPSTSSGNSK